MSTDDEDSVPYVSVVIPAYNEEHIIEECIQNILDQRDPPPYELIIVDDASTDNTNEIVQDYVQQYDQIKLLEHETNKGMVIGFNDGAKVANGKILSFTGADTMFHEDYLRRVAEHGREGADLILGYVVVRNKERFHPMAAHLTKEHNPDRKYGGSAQNVRREKFLETSGFKGHEGKAHDGEDQELIHRAEELGWTIVRDDDAIVYSEFPTSLREVLKRKIWAGHMYMTYTSEHPEEIRLVRRIAGGLYFWVTLAVLLLTLISPFFAVVSVPLLSVFLVYNFPKSWAMYKESGKPSWFILRYVYDFVGGLLRFLGYMMAWEEMVTIARAKLG